MSILFDENFPRPLRRFFPDQQVTTDQKMEWLEAERGNLLAIAEAEFDVLLSADKGIKYQQNFTGRDIAVIVLRTRDNRMPTLIQRQSDADTDPADAKSPCSFAYCPVRPGLLRGAVTSQPRRKKRR